MDRRPELNQKIRTWEGRRKDAWQPFWFGLGLLLGIVGGQERVPELTTDLDSISWGLTIAASAGGMSLLVALCIFVLSTQKIKGVKKVRNAL